MSSDQRDFDRLAERTAFDREALEQMSDDQLEALASTVEELDGTHVAESDGNVDTSTGFEPASGAASGPDSGGASDSDSGGGLAPGADGASGSDSGGGWGQTAGQSRDTGPTGEQRTDVVGGGKSVLSAENLLVSYGQVTALKDLDLQVNEGELVSLIGPNGAGKTTFADTATGYLDYRGSLQYQGREVADFGQADLVDQGMIYCSEDRNLFGYMDVEDNLRLGGFREDDATVERNLEFVYDLFPRLEERREQNARSMSGGEQQMLAIGRALVGNPDLLILDEPTLGLAPVILESISEALDPIRDQGVSILLTEQNVTFALDHADRIYLLENGEVVRTGTPEQLAGDDYIRETYLGG